MLGGCLDYPGFFSQLSTSQCVSCRLGHLGRLLDGTTGITSLNHICQQIAQSTSKFQHIVTGNVREYEPLPDAPLTCKWDSTGEAIEVFIFIECLEETF